MFNFIEFFLQVLAVVNAILTYLGLDTLNLPL